MKDHDSAIASRTAPLLPRAGLWWGFLGVLAFSFTVPFTRVAVEALSPLFTGAARAVVAAVLAATALLIARAHIPSRMQCARLSIVAAGIVVGFPLLTSFALETASASHGAVIVGTLPAATAVAAVIRGGERPSALFWVFALLGAVAAAMFASSQSGAVGAFTQADLLLLAAVFLAAIGYAEGGLLARELGAWQAVSWALVLAFPLMLVLTGVSVLQQPPIASAAQWLAFAYLGTVRMFLGFLAWYRGLATGPMVQVSQVQLVQPVLSLAWAAMMLRETISPASLLGGLAVITCAAIAVRTRSKPKEK